MGPTYEIWLNGEYYPRDRAQISMLDRGFKLGDVVYDTLRTFDGRLYKLTEHLERFERTLRYVRIDPGLSMTSLGRLIQEVVDRNEPVRREFGDDYMISPIVTRGTGYRIKDAGDPSVSVFIDPIDFASYGPMYSRGARGVITRSRSLSPQQLDPKVKHFSRLSYVMADLEASDVDPQAFPIMLDMDGNVTEERRVQFRHRKRRGDPHPPRHGDPPGRVQARDRRARRDPRHTRHRGRPSALRRLHRRRGLLVLDAVLPASRRQRR